MGSLCHTIFWGRAMGLLHALEEGASNLLRPPGTLPVWGMQKEQKKA